MKLTRKGGGASRAEAALLRAEVEVEVEEKGGCLVVPPQKPSSREKQRNRKQ